MLGVVRCPKCKLLGKTPPRMVHSYDMAVCRTADITVVFACLNFSSRIAGALLMPAVTKALPLMPRHRVSLPVAIGSRGGGLRKRYSYNVQATLTKHICKNKMKWHRQNCRQDCCIQALAAPSAACCPAGAASSAPGAAFLLRNR